MLAGCPALLSPRHRLRSEASVQLQACHFQLQDKLGSMSTQRLDLPCSFNRKETTPRSPKERGDGQRWKQRVERRAEIFWIWPERGRVAD
ncbi:hypothetical protein MRB53_012087 [Persea americana]|uniref:Uncharacterized protein n=1 Tax=Persea americana TaxID=3435 RepID=A0ACC2LWQ1_PERAE|nr:hypothetical protein MRB53_012087 [Persea americana]